MEEYQGKIGVQYELRRVIDALPGLVWTALPDGHIDFVNQRWREYTGLSLDEACGQGWLTAIQPEDLPELLEHWQSILASGEPGEMEARLRRFDGEYRWFHISASPLRDTAGEIVNWYGVSTDIEDRRRAEEALRVRELSFRLIVDSIPAPVAVTTPSGEVEGVNRPTLEYFGKTLEELKGWAISDVVHADDLPYTVAAQREAHETGSTYNVESRHRRADGIYRWFNVRGFPLRDTEGRILRWFHLQIDIDDRKRAEALLAGEKRLLEMVALGNSLPVVLDALCRLVEEIVSGCYCCILLIDPTGTRFQRGAAPSLASSYYESKNDKTVHCDSGPCGMAASLKREVIVPDVASERRWDAHEWRTLNLAHGLRSCWSTPILSRARKTLGTFAIYHREPGSPTPFQRDLIGRFTRIASIAIERTQNEEALKRSEAFLAEAQHLSRIGSFSWHMATDEITWSEQLYRIFEFDLDVPVTLELIGTRVHPEDKHLMQDMIARAQGKAQDFEYEHRLLMPDHSVRYLHLIAHATRDQDGRLEYIGAVQDVTQRRLSEEALGKARSELAHVARITSLGVLTASIAHEVNQPLSGIITNASTCLRMLNADPPNVEGARETARRTIRDGNRASDVIKRLRALFAKKDATTESVDLNEATREVMALSLSKLQRNRVILLPELADDLPPVTGDRVQLQQVIMNLLLNASEAMSGVDDRPRQLVIRTERHEGDHVRLTVQDVGVGFEPQGVDRLFEAFYTTKSGGMGIGLSVSRSIIESHQGRLWAAPNEGPGATFSFSIPRASEGVTGAASLGAIRTPAVTDAAHVRRNA